MRDDKEKIMGKEKNESDKTANWQMMEILQEFYYALVFSFFACINPPIYINYIA